MKEECLLYTALCIVPLTSLHHCTFTSADTAALEARVTKLEQSRYKCPKGVVVDDSMRRARTAVEGAASGLYSARWKWVPPHYYDKSLTERAKILQVPSTKLLCKALLLENKKISADKINARTNPKFVMVVLQYDATLDVKKLQNAMRSLIQPVTERAKYDHDFRVASAEENDRLTGYQFNSVTPFGLLRPKEVRMVLAKAIQDDTPYFWMGGGHVHLKLGMATSDFIESTDALVADISSPRNGDTAASEFD